MIMSGYVIGTHSLPAVTRLLRMPLSRSGIIGNAQQSRTDGEKGPREKPPSRLAISTARRSRCSEEPPKPSWRLRSASRQTLHSTALASPSPGVRKMTSPCIRHFILLCIHVSHREGRFRPCALFCHHVQKKPVTLTLRRSTHVSTLPTRETSSNSGLDSCLGQHLRGPVL